MMAKEAISRTEMARDGIINIVSSMIVGGGATVLAVMAINCSCSHILEIMERYIYLICGFQKKTGVQALLHIPEIRVI